MQQDADFITADFHYMFRVSWAHHQEYEILTWQPPVQEVMVAGGSALRHIRDETKSRLEGGALILRVFPQLLLTEPDYLSILTRDSIR